LDLTADPTSWTQWWHYNRAPYLALKAHVFAQATLSGSEEFELGAGQTMYRRGILRPTDEEVRAQVVPALLERLRRERARDIQSSALIALAKIGAKIGALDEASDAELTRAFLPFLADGDQEVAETAAIALGILGREASLAPLFALLQDSPVGRELVGTTEVPYRTRSFAAYGLGLLGSRSEDNALRQRIAEGLVAVLESQRFSTRDVEVAAVTAFGLIRIDGRPAVPPRSAAGDHGPYSRHVVSRRAQIAYLAGLFEASRKTGKKLVRAHAATALARLAGKGPDDLKALVAPLLLGTLGVHAKEPIEVEQACTLALGILGDADDDKLDEKIRATLERLLRTGRPLTRGFAAIALAKVGARPGFGASPIAGTAACRRALLSSLARGSTLQKPWAALALGVLGHGLLEHGVAPDPGVGQALRAVAADCRRPHEIGAYAVALGLRRDPESLKLLLDKLEFFAADEARAPIAVALGLQGERAAIGPILAILKDSKFRPDLIAESAIGLALLGDKTVVPELLEMLKSARSLASQASIATALGLIGDRRSIEPLLAMLGNEGLTDTARAFAVVSLGSVCDPRSLPWNTPIALDVNYRALTSTLVGNSTGVLDIL